MSPFQGKLTTTIHYSRKCFSKTIWRMGKE